MNKNSSIKQCVLICQPISSDYESSSVFNKIGTTPVIDLCINWLHENGIQEFFLFYSNTKTQIQQYAYNFQKNCKENMRLHLNFMKPQKLKNFGDVMREVRFRDIIFQDFIILFADTISNLNLTKAINNHLRKKIELKTVMLTTVLRQDSFDNKIQIISPQTGEILQMEQDTGADFSLNDQRINLKKYNVQLRRDLTHCDIYICSMDVLKNFKDNQEYSTMFDYINCVLTLEGSQDKIVGHILEKQEKCFRINKTKDYYLAYIHYISNNFYPNIVSQKAKYVHKNFNKVIHNGVSIPRSVYISNNSYIGQGCTLALDVQVQKSILTNSCRIDRLSTIKNCIILQGCVIPQKSNFENSLIEKVNETLQIRSFNILQKYQAKIITLPLFDQTPPPQQCTFQQNLRQILEDDPQIQIVRQLNAVRYHHNKPLQQLFRQVLQIKSPKNPKQVQQFVRDWGQILLKTHDKQNLLINSLYYSCENVTGLDKAFHLFLQYFYKQQLLKDFVIIQWYEQYLIKYPESPLLQRCQKFIEMLREQDDQQEQQQEQNRSSNSSSNEEQTQ